MIDMKIGIINKIFEDTECKVKFADTDILVPNGENCEILNGNPFSVKWEDARDSGIEYCIDLGRICFVDRVKMKLGSKSKLVSAILKKDEILFNKYKYSVSEIANNNEIVFEIGCVAKEISICLESDFSGIEVLSADVYGAVIDCLDVFPVPKKSNNYGKDFNSKIC